jgi:hypothetical protein
VVKESLVLDLFKVYIFPDGRILIRTLRPGGLGMGLPPILLCFLHIPELLTDMPGRAGHGYDEVKYEPVQQVKYDRQEKNLG